MATSIKVKGTKSGLLVTLGEGEWPTLRDELLAHFTQQADFLKGAELALDVGPLALNASELGKLRDTLGEMGIALKTLISQSPKTETTARILGLGTILPTPRPERSSRRLSTNLQGQGEPCIYVHRTLRSGFKLEYEGHVTILGDVNPGAEIIAWGSIIVWGRLRGMVHAGANGNTDAIVCALDLNPTQLRLAGEIAVPTKPGKPRPEMALMRNGKVVAEPWNPKGK